jgi:regulator of chromosome condensation
VIYSSFQGNDGLLGFSVAEAVDGARLDDDYKKFRRTPVLIPELKKIKYIAAGGNHVQALDHKGSVFVWGSGEQCQLGRRIVERSKAQALTPRQFGLPKNKIKYISCGSYHGFAVDTRGQVWAWGHNNYCQTGVVGERGEVEQFVERPTIVKSLEPYRIKEIQGGNHHSIACTEDGEVLVWGRCDDGQAGISLETLSKASIIFDDREQARILKTPSVVPGTSFHLTS